MHLRVVGGPAGASTKVYVDGKQLKRCFGVKYEVQAAGIAKVTLEMWPEVIEIDTVTEKARIINKKLKRK